MSDTPPLSADEEGPPLIFTEAGSQDDISVADEETRDENVLIKTNPVNNPKGTSTLGTVFLIVNAALGAGLLNFPQAFDKAGGVLTAFLVQAVFLVFIMVALIILCSTANIKGSNTLQDVMYTVAGHPGRLITSFIIALYCFGTCITFLIIIGDQFDRAFASLVGPSFCHHWYLNRDFVMPASAAVLILPLCYTKKIDFLKYASAMGVFTVIYVVCLIIYEYFSGNYVPGPIKTSPDTWLDVFFVIPVICFGYQCHVSVIPIYSCMENRDLKHFSIASSVAIAVCVFAYTGAATFGYLTFGSKVAEDIISNYSASSPAVLIALIAMALKTYTTYPILLFCGREAMSTIIKDLFIREDTPLKELCRRSVIATVWFLASVILAIEIPDIGEVIEVLGSLAAIFIFVFPGVCLFQTTLLADPSLFTTSSKVKLAGAITFIVLGVFLFGVVLTQGIISDIGPHQDNSQLCRTTPRAWRMFG